MSAEEGTRRIALALLRATIAARERLDRSDDVEALHDFRVALRRLRSWMRALGRERLSSVRKRDRRALTTLSRAAGSARDAEVHVAWLRDAEHSWRPRERPGGEWLLRRLVDQHRAADAAFRALLADGFSRTVTRLGKALAVYTIRVDLRDPRPVPTLALAIAPLIQEHAAALGDRLSAIRSVQDQALAHAARIAGKRLRYTLEPIADSVRDGPQLVKRLRHLQDTIGEMHDVHVMAETVIAAAEEAGAEQARRTAAALLEGAGVDSGGHREHTPDLRPGLLATAALLRSRGDSAYLELQQRWLGPHALDLTRDARAVAATLAGTIDDSSTGAPQLDDGAPSERAASVAPA